MGNILQFIHEKGIEKSLISIALSMSKIILVVWNLVLKDFQQYVFFKASANL